MKKILITLATLVVFSSFSACASFLNDEQSLPEPTPTVKTTVTPTLTAKPSPSSVSSKEAEINSEPMIDIPDEPDFGYPAIETSPHFYLEFLTDETASKLSDYEEFIEFPDEENFRVILTPKAKMVTLEYCSLKFNEETSKMEIDEVIFSANDISEEKPFIVDWYSPGVMPQRAVNFTYENDESSMLTLQISGKDGAVFLANE